MIRLHPRFHDAVHLFNSGAYFECHEVLEELWREEPTSLRLFYQGLLQIAVGCYHLTVRRNKHGAISKLKAGGEKLEMFPSVMDGVDLNDLRQQVQHLLEWVQEVDEEQLFAQSMERLPIVRYLV